LSRLPLGISTVIRFMQYSDTPLLLLCIIRHGNMPPPELRVDEGGKHGLLAPSAGK
jgi:hypothetical protein